jgi:dipeptidyl aminopeptidase/acylaminoacyl peptidase
MGHVELEDQVAGLQAAAQIAPFIDLTRVAITGWSYGGYMALIGIAKRPDVFKVAISGAPVTDMSWYDTGYTERYLGMPPAESYNKSSVLSLAPHFPSSPGRLLIIHGMSDENVLYTHTSLLIDALVANGKPYQLQLFNNERHGIRSFTASNHCDGTILNFLLRHL